MTIAIIGGGIAGLSSAIALKLAGFEPHVFERSSVFAELGAGLQISPNGMKVLEALGVDLIRPFEPETVTMKRGKTGRDVFSLPIKAIARTRWGAPFVQIHRADLHKSLETRAQALNIPISFGQNFDAERLSALNADFIVGADGVNSTVRKLYFQGDKPVFSGNVAYRATVPLHALKNPPPPSSVIWSGHKKHAVTYYIQAGETVNFVGICEEADWQKEGWNHDVEPNRVRENFADFDPIVRDMLEQAKGMKRWALLYHPPLKSFAQDKVALVGDAAHPMLPSFAQGAVQALEDAYALAACLKAGQIERYTQIRKPRVTRVQHESRKNLELYHQGALGRAVFHTGASVLNRLSQEALLKRLDWLYGYNIRAEVQSYI